MTSIRIFAASLLALACVSCAAQKPNSSATTDQFGTAAGGPVTQPVNPVYDTPAAYEETGAAAAPVVAAVGAVSQPNIPAAAAAKPATVAKPATNGAAIIHTVVAGDTLSGISSKYKVSAAAIKQANNMTKDTVVLGKKMVIPPAH